MTDGRSSTKRRNILFVFKWLQYLGMSASDPPLLLIPDSRFPIPGSRLSSTLRNPRELLGLEFLLQWLNEILELSFHHIGELVQREIDAVIGDASLREILGADAFGTVALDRHVIGADAVRGDHPVAPNHQIQHDTPPATSPGLRRSGLLASR